MRTMSRGVTVALWVATAVAAFGIGWITPPPHRALAPDDLVDSLREALGEPDVIERQQRTAQLLERLDADPLLDVAALYERMIPLIDASELAAFFAAWARFDTIGALEYAGSWRLPEMRKQREIGLRAAIQVWAQRDPEAASLAAEQIGTETPTLRGAMREALAMGWARSPQGQEGLADFLAGLPPLRDRHEIIDGVARELVRGGGAEAALGWAEPILRDGDHDLVFKRSVFRAVAAAAAQWDPVRTAAWAEEHSRADYAEDGVSIVAKYWGRRNGEAALNWLGEQPAGELRDQAVREAFGEWSKTDPLTARDWLVEEKPAALRDPALEFKANRIVDLEPERALGFCERIEDAGRRRSCLESTAKIWYAKDAVAAETWLQQSSLDEEARSRVRERPTPKEQRRSPRRPRVGGDMR